MRIFLFLVFPFFSSFAQQPPRKFLVVGLTASTLTASSSKIANLQIVSGIEQGFFIAGGKDFSLSEEFDFQLRLKISETGGKIENSTFYIKEKFSTEIEKYRNATLKAEVYQIGFEANISHKIKFLKIFTGLQPSFIFFGTYKEKGVKKEDTLPGPIPPPPDQSTLLVDYNLLNLCGQGGASIQISEHFFIDISYHFTINNNVLLKYENMKINIKQNFLQIGLGYYF